MKIKVTDMAYPRVLELPPQKHHRPRRQAAFFRWLMKTMGAGELRRTNFVCTRIYMERLGEDEPCLFLMNHSSFTDLKIAAKLLRKRPYHIVCTNDGFVGKSKLMERLGCIPAVKFISDISLVKDMKYCFDNLRESVLMFPEASYSFDGTATPLPHSLGKCIKLMDVPVVMIRTTGAFLRDPLYNGLKKRNCSVTASMKYLLSRDEIAEKTAEEINAILKKEFDYNHFYEQYKNGVQITEPFRAEGLHRVLYKCPHCWHEGGMVGSGTEISCSDCGVKYRLQADGTLIRTEKEKESKFNFVPEWYAWERECVRKELKNGSYSMEEPVDILVLKDFKSMYRVGEGVLTHTENGFKLVGDGIDFSVKISSSYSLYADYFWYEIGDMISIGNSGMQFYCFPKNQKTAVVAKARLAAEELFKIYEKAKGREAGRICRQN